MHWIDIAADFRQRPAPDFRLSDADGQEVSAYQFRRRQHLVLVFVPGATTPALAPFLAALAEAQDELAQASATVLAIAPRPQPVPLTLLVDADNAVRERYAALLAPDQSPARDEPFVVILNRYGVPEAGARDMADGAQAASDLVTRVWGIEYQCSL